jgi:SNF2 family DNA or RNA helicase
MLPPHEYQKRGRKFILEHQRAFLMVDMGLGKTRIVLDTIASLNMPVLVMAPLQPIHTTWQDEIAKWQPDLTYTILHGDSKKARLKLKKRIYLINYHGLKWLYNCMMRGWIKPRKYIVVFDESTFIKSSTTARFKLLLHMRPQFSNWRVCLSGTPSPNGLQDLWGQYFFLDNGERLGSSYPSFRDNYFLYTGYPTYTTTPLVGSESKIMTKISDITFRLDAKDYIDMPEIVYNNIYVEHSDEWMRQYSDLEDEFYMEFSDQSTVTAFSAAALSSKLRQFVQGGVYLDNSNRAFRTIHTKKAEVLKEVIESLNGKPVLVPIQFRFELEMLRRVFKQDLPCIHGGTKADDATAYIRKWNSRRLPVLLCHPASLGHGVNLQAGGSTIIWYGLTWNLEHYQQTIGRLYRQGQEDRVIVHHLITRDTIEKRVAMILKRKDATQGQLLEGMRRRTPPKEVPCTTK